MIPLINFSGTGQLGIQAKLGTNPNSFTYILDTGSFGFFTAVGTTNYWTGAVPAPGPSPTPFAVAYGTGSLAYSGYVTHTNVTFTDINGNPLVVENVRMGVITNQPYPNWNADIDTLPVPIAPERSDTHQFFGTLGAGLDATQLDPGGDCSSVLGQIPVPKGLIPGFIIRTGGPNSKSATLTIGLTQEAITSFPIIIPMNAMQGVRMNDNGTMVNLYPQAQTTAAYSITANSSNYLAEADLIMDTGGEGTHFTNGMFVNVPPAVLSGNLIASPGTVFTVVSGTNYPGTMTLAGNLEWTINTGTTAYVDKVTVQQGDSAGSLNTGIALFYEYDVMFDTADGVIGLRPVPPPTPTPNPTPAPNPGKPSLQIGARDAKAFFRTRASSIVVRGTAANVDKLEWRFVGQAGVQRVAVSGSQWKIKVTGLAPGRNFLRVTGVNATTGAKTSEHKAVIMRR